MSDFFRRFLGEPTAKDADNSGTSRPDVGNVELFQRGRPTALEGATDGTSECRDFQNGSQDPAPRSDISDISDSQACDPNGNPLPVTDRPRPPVGKNDEGILA